MRGKERDSHNGYIYEGRYQSRYTVGRAFIKSSRGLLALICIEREEQKCHRSYVTEREKVPFVEPQTFCYTVRKQRRIINPHYAFTAAK
jgi:hypothetical protein